MKTGGRHEDFRLVNLTEEAWTLVAERERRRRELDAAVSAVPTPTVASSLQRIADKMPVALNVEMTSIRIRAADEGKDLHLLAAAGAAEEDLRRLAHQPLSVAQARTIAALGPRHSDARRLGLCWLQGTWLRHGGETLGFVLVGTRTERRPSAVDLARLELAAERLGERVAPLDRRTRQLRLVGVEVGRGLIHGRPSFPADDPMAMLRPRERTVLDLYADGLSTRQIADLLVLSPHTVRTHVKLALRRLGVHSREEAEMMIREQRVLKLL